MNILTIDLEDWFHILDHPETESPAQWEKFESRIERNVNRLLDLLEEKKLKASWFCLGWIAKKYPEMIRRISVSHHIACHSDVHILVYSQTPTKFRDDCLRSKHILEDIISKPVNVYRAPGFSVTEKTPWFFETILECGFDTDCSVFPGSRQHGGLKNFGQAVPCRIDIGGTLLKEFPMNTTSVFGHRIVFSGGGYFRVLPYSLIRYFFDRSDYVMSYFHPRDFDSGQPLLSSLSLKRKFMSYTGLKSSEKKLRRLLQDYTFVSIPDADLLTDWTIAPIVRI